MNPFNDINNRKATASTGSTISIWVENYGRKHNTFISGWEITPEEMKEHLKTIKKKNGCNGTIKDMEVDGTTVESVMQLQGDHAEYVKTFIIGTGVPESSVYIKG